MGGGVCEGVDVSGSFSIVVLREGENEEKRRRVSASLKQSLQHGVARKLTFSEENQT